MTRATITIDGSFADWQAAVLGDPDNVISDPVGDNVQSPVGNYDRDLEQVAATWDDNYLYLYFQRASIAANASLSFVTYVDLNADGRMQSSDRIVEFPFGGQGTPATANWYAYVPVDTANGDLLTGDNFAMPGGADNKIKGTIPAPSHARDSANIVCEARVSWSTIASGTPLPVMLKFGCGAGINQVGDNTNVLHLLRRGVTLTPDRDAAGTAGMEVAVPHTITNTGNAYDTFSLTATPTAWSPHFSASQSGSDITTIGLAAGASSTIYMHATPPVDTPDGTRKTYSVRASCTTSSTVRAEVTDEIYVGALLVIPDNQGYMAPGETITYQTNVRNNASVAETVSIAAQGDLGWAAHVFDGATEVTQAVIPAQTTLPLTLQVSVPSTAAVGTQEQTHLRATLASSPAVFAESSNLTNARPAIEVTPDRDTYGGDGTSVYLRHTVRNSWPDTRTVSLAADTASSWTTQTLVADGSSSVTTLQLGPNGGTAEFLVRVGIPAGTAAGHVETATIGVAAGTHSDSAQDLIRVTRLATYDSAGFTNPCTQFKLGSTVYGRAMGITPGTTVNFSWRKAGGSVVASETRTANAQGTAWSSYAPTGVGAIGDWELESVVGSVVTTASFTVSYDVSILDRWATDVTTVGGNSDIGIRLHKGGTTDLPPSRVDYLVWWDSDANGAFGVGDLYIDAASETVTFTGGPAPVTSQGIVPTMTPGTDYVDSWLLNNGAFTRGGTWQVAMSWKTGDIALGSTTDSFYSAMSAFNMTISAGTVGFGSVSPEDTGAVPITLTIHSTRTYSLSTSYVNAPALGLSTTLGPQPNVPPGNYTYNDNLSVNIPWGQDGLVTSQVVYTAVVQ
jgi:hypothetical protein